jgi:predicted ATP-dependent serine protease
VPQAPLRVREAVQMGFTRIVMPEVNVDPTDTAPAAQGCEIVGVRSVAEALDRLIP